eukprot:4831759-Prymnesium_polylepis.1
MHIRFITAQDTSPAAARTSARQNPLRSHDMAGSPKVAATCSPSQRRFTNTMMPRRFMAISVSGDDENLGGGFFVDIRNVGGGEREGRGVGVGGVGGCGGDAD